MARRHAKATPRIDENVWQQVETLIRDEWSPEQIVGRLEDEQGVCISYEWIYQYIYADKRSGGDLYRCLRCQKPRRKRYSSYERRSIIPKLISIDERPAIVHTRQRLGDWEGDTVTGKGHRSALVTLLERKSLYTVIRAVRCKTAEGVRKAVRCGLRPYRDRVDTITYDNCRELADHEGIISFVSSPVVLAANDAMPDQAGGPLKRLIKRISSTRESVILSAACDSGTLSLNRGEASCARCPSYTSKPGDAGGFSLVSIISGSFTKPNTSGAVLNMSGCESRVDASGGVVLVRQQKKGWSRIWCQPGHRLTDCIGFRANRNVQSLLCNRGNTLQGVESGELVWVSLDEHGMKINPLISWYDNIQSNPRDLVIVYPYRLFRSDFNQDERVDVRVMFNVMEHRIPQKYGGALDAIDQNYQLPEPEKLGVIYLFDGNNLSLHPNSEPNLKKLYTFLEKYTKNSEE